MTALDCRHHLTGFGIWLVLVASLSGAKAQQLQSGTKDFDVVCAVVSAAQVTTTQEGSDARNFAFHVH